MISLSNDVDCEVKFPVHFAHTVGRVLSAAICLVSLLPSDGVAAEQTPLRIMPLGDSITQGDDGSYRRPLWIALKEADISVDFVGSMGHGYSGDNESGNYDTDHEGHWGWRADEVLKRIDQWAARNIPDIVLMHLAWIFHPFLRKRDFCVCMRGLNIKRR